MEPAAIDLSNPETNQEFTGARGNTTIYEMQGLIPLLNAAATDADVELKTHKHRKAEYASAREAVTYFYKYLGRLVYNGLEILDPGLVAEYKKWNACMYPDPSENPEHFYTGVALSERIQYDLWLKGIKDTNRGASLPFPCEVYLPEDSSYDTDRK